MARLRELGESGMSLVEMMVAIFIFTILTVTALSVMITLLDTSSSANHRFDNVDDVQPVMDVLTSDIRAASTVCTANPESVVIVTDLGYAGGPVLMDFTLSTTGSLNESSEQSGACPTSSAPFQPTAGHVLTSKIVYPSSNETPVFSYFDSTGATTTTAASVASVAINLVDNDDTDIPASAATVTAQVWLRNVLYSDANT